MDMLRSSRMELNGTNLFQNEDKVVQYTRSVVFFMPFTEDVTTVFVDPEHNLKQLINGAQSKSKKKKASHLVKEST
jgi:hypothetical protein